MQLLKFLSIISFLLFIGGACGTAKTTDVKKQETITGKLSSKKGVMNRISCYCFDSGYLTTPSGDIFAVCFKGVKSDDIKCFDNISLTGKFESVKITPKEGEVCQAGTLRLFMVKSFECN